MDTLSNHVYCGYLVEQEELSIRGESFTGTELILLECACSKRKYVQLFPYVDR
ncbi:hypothetical protein LR48_Vigan11g078800 [Vigna angularis]|uniref:Uncharacterized protein n=1 Tax=Phaseolus angularis TaxID=3914 RepID=A0A0L9VRQ8_PHAAN|nr:hypothetical protein LR48_Vigan11g078800 [Vigna angularis]